MNISQESVGVVERIIPAGFGFISVADHQGDVFFHRKELAPGLEFDEALVRRRVKFKLSQTHKGWNATDITAAD
jgi:cold shock CspA family protein